MKISQSIREMKTDFDKMPGGPSLNGNTGEDEAKLTELQEQIKEYEDYQKILRESIRPDSATVRVLSSQLIKKIDLIDDLISRYSKTKKNKEVSQQLTILRKSFLDFLSDNSVNAFEFAPRTELEMDLRRKIKIVSTKQRAEDGITRIVETVTPGYTCADDEGGEVIIRKAEVVTHA